MLTLVTAFLQIHQKCKLSLYFFLVYKYCTEFSFFTVKKQMEYK